MYLYVLLLPKILETWPLSFSVEAQDFNQLPKFDISDVQRKTFSELVIFYIFG